MEFEFPGSGKFWAKVKRGEPEECWPWQGALSRGYGHVSSGGKNRTAHRFLWIALYGELPPGYHVHHRCRNSACQNPAHLDALTADAHRREPHRLRVRCKRGHALTADNVYTFKARTGTWGRVCKACIRVRLGPGFKREPSLGTLLNVRMTHHERRRIIAMARDQGITASEWIRRAAMEALSHNTEPEHA
ncbi:MAG: HNH endonuclease [Gammaproteobacteria bacterium]